MAQAPQNQPKKADKRPQIVQHETLVRLLEKEKDDVIVVDVRTKDFVGGNIPNAINIPKDGKELFDNAIKRKLFELKLYEKKYIVFHCMYCQQRGPNCANIYCKLVTKLINNNSEDSSKNDKDSNEPAWVKQHRLKQNKNQNNEDNDKQITDETIEQLSNQQVMILKGGFNGWYNAFEEGKLEQHLQDKTAKISFVANVDKSYWKLFEDDVTGVKKFVHIYDC